MAVITLNRYGDLSGCVFDAATVVEKARETFPGMKQLPGDQLTLSVERAVAAGAADHVVRTLRRNRQEYGPAYAFEIGTDEAVTIQGRARRYDVTFLFPDSLPEPWREQLLAFLRSLGPGRLESDNLARPA